MLRQLRPDDLSFVSELFADLAVMRYSLTGPLVAAQAAEFLTRTIENYGQRPLGVWGIGRLPAGQLVGLCGFQPGEFEGKPVWELAFRLMPDVWGRGLATEAARACLDVAARVGNSPEVVAWSESANTASQRVLEKVGLRPVGLFPRQGLACRVYRSSIEVPATTVEA